MSQKIAINYLTDIFLYDTNLKSYYIFRIRKNYHKLCIRGISLYSLPFTGFGSLPESVQTNLSKSPRKPPSNLPRDM